jgi:hypothetical protein
MNIPSAKMHGLSAQYQERVERTRRREEMLKQQPGHVVTRPVHSFLKAAVKETAPIDLSKSRR